MSNESSDIRSLLTAILDAAEASRKECREADQKIISLIDTLRKDSRTDNARLEERIRHVELASVLSDGIDKRVRQLELDFKEKEGEVKVLATKVSGLVAGVAIAGKFMIEWLVSKLT